MIQYQRELSKRLLSVTNTNWLNSLNCVWVEVGEYVETDEVVAIIETDKINIDIRSTYSGVITKYFANEGDTVAVDS